MRKAWSISTSVIAMVITLLEQSAAANSMDNAYSAGINAGKGSFSNMTEIMNRINPDQLLPNDRQNLDISDVDLEDQDAFSSLVTDAQRLSHEDPQLNALLNHVNGSRPSEIDPNNPLFASSLSIEARAQTLIPNNGYCFNGECVDSSYASNDEFAQVATALSAVGEGADDYGWFSQIFQGQAMGCNKNILDFKDCCVEKGWGLDINLASCSQEEKQLGLAREQQRTIDIGRYCAESLLGVCYRTKRVFCVFRSKMAKIVQGQGRFQQLGINFGSARNPACSGLSPEALQQLDFATIDLSPLYAEVEAQAQLPSIDDLQWQAIQDLNHAIR